MQDAVPTDLMDLLQDQAPLSRRNPVTDIINEAFHRAAHALQLTHDYHLDNQGMPMPQRPRHDKACYPYPTAQSHIVPQIDTFRQRPTETFNRLRDVIEANGRTVVRHLAEQMIEHTGNENTMEALRILNNVDKGPAPHFTAAGAQLMLAVEQIGQLELAACKRDLGARFPMPSLSLPYKTSYAA